MIININDEWLQILLSNSLDEKRNRLRKLLVKVCEEQRKICADKLRQGNSYAQNKGVISNAPLVSIN
jgi:hypothetical protein